MKEEKFHGMAFMILKKMPQELFRAVHFHNFAPNFRKKKALSRKTLTV